MTKFWRALDVWLKESSYFSFTSNTPLNSLIPPLEYGLQIESKKLSLHFQSCSISSAQKYPKGDCSRSPLLELHGSFFESWVTHRHLVIIRSIIMLGPGEHFTWQLIYIILGTTCSQIFHVHIILLRWFYNGNCLLKWNMQIDTGRTDASPNKQTSEWSSCLITLI